MKSETTPEINSTSLEASANLFPVVGIGASAGGLDAFKKLLKAIPEDSGMAYVLVQHLDPSHESMLPELLQKVTRIPVLEITHDVKVEPDHIYVIPSNKIMIATDGVLLLAPRPPKQNLDPNMPIDRFFCSLAEVHQAHAIGVVLSGTATDGTLGLKAIKDHGGITLAQDEASAAFEGMPQSAAQAGVVDFVLPPDKIPAKILEITKSLAGRGDLQLHQQIEKEEMFKQITSLLRIKKGTDFTYYKQTTIQRRILRRMALTNNEEPAAYLKFLRENKQEVDTLYQDLLIPVTSFFRDPKSFANLCESIFPQIISNNPHGETIRVWVAGCSTGEEAYSIAICIREFLGDSRQRVQIFATDLSEIAIAKARIGIYSKNELKNVSFERLEKYFTRTNGSYQVNKVLREACVFAVHNFVKDPPFGKIDLISCRNVLIYMEPYLQKKALTTFHYSLNPKGFLLLGKSETTSGVPELFAPAVKGDKIFTRKPGLGKFMHVATERSEQNLSQSDSNAQNEYVRTDFQKVADDIMLSKYTPAGVVVNEAMDIVHFRGKTGSYLEQGGGKPSHNLFKMAKHGLAFELRNLMHKCKKQNGVVVKESIPLEENGRVRNIAIEASQLPNISEPHYLILFLERETMPTDGRYILESGAEVNSASSKRKKNASDLRIMQLEQELSETREDMRSITEAQEAANEELQSDNEELLSGSEELQSLNEELETNKEELQSTNEELTVVNQEIINLNEQVTEARDFAEAINATIHEPMLILDRNLRIKSANKAFYKLFNIQAKDAEGVNLFQLDQKQWNIPKLRELLEEIIPKNSHFDDFELTQDFPGIGEKTLMMNGRLLLQKTNHEQLILLAMYDVTELRRLALELSNQEKRGLLEQLEIETNAKKNIEMVNAELVIEKGIAEHKTKVAEDAVKTKQQFLSNMSHEIRTPMNAIIGFTNVVLKTTLDDNQREYIGAIKSSGDALIVLINDILDLAKVDAGKMTFEEKPFNLSDAISAMLQLFEHKIKEKNLELSNDLDPRIPALIVGDPMRLRQIILNLMSNAVKFTTKGHIAFSIRLLEESLDHTSIEFTISDTGIGISDDRLQHVFKNFEQAHIETASSYGGTGLGLAIVKQLVELQGGSIFVRSEIGKGSTFGFILNFAKANLKPGDATPHALEIRKPNGNTSNAIRPVRILVAEDVALNQLLIRIIIADFGFDLDIAANGKIAIEMLKQNEYDVVLMDLQMPEMNGFEATGYIRGTMHSTVPIIALTADVTPIDIERCKEIGMNDYVSKPIDEKVLYSKILHCLQSRA